MHECPECGQMCACDGEDTSVEWYPKCRHYLRRECEEYGRDDDEDPPDCPDCGCAPCDCDDDTPQGPQLVRESA